MSTVIVMPPPISHATPVANDAAGGIGPQGRSSLNGDAVDSAMGSGPATTAPGAAKAPVSQRLVPQADGRLRIEGVSDNDRHLCVLMHLSPFSLFFFPILMATPLVAWLVRKDQSPFVDDHGKEILNFLIGLVLLLAIMAISCLLVIGIPVALVGVPAVLICGVVNLIRGAVAAGRGELFRYPMTIRLLS